MTAADLIELRELLRTELPRVVRQAVREELQRQRDSLTPGQRATLKALTLLFEAGEVFTTGTALDAARFDDVARAALHRACGLDAQRLGIVMRQIADAGAQHDGLRLLALPPEAGARRWTLVTVEPL